MNLTDDLLMAYADGELDAKTQAQVEQAIAADPQAARRVAAHKALRSQLRSTFDKVLDEPIPDRLLAAARAAPQRPPANAVVVPFRSRTKPKPPLPYWGAIAASFVMGALVWHFGADLYTSSPVTEQNGQLLAAGALEQALSNQLAKDQTAQAPVQIGVSFRSRSGSYCRTFQVREQSSLAGLACREDGRWKLNVLARGEASGQAQPEFRPAGSALPAPVLQAVEQAIDGDPLDAQAEAQAQTNQWRASK